MDFNTQKLSHYRIESILKQSPIPKDAPVSINRLVSVYFRHYTFDGSVKDGEWIVLDVLGPSVLTIAKKLYDLKFPMEQCIPIDVFGGDDVLSMEQNNSSAFNCRKVMNTDRWSSHAFGAAVDVNPIQNPYVLINEEDATAKIYPSQGTAFLNRHIQSRGMVEPVVELFAQFGFTQWGGNWKSPLDYHHFQLPWDEIHNLNDQRFS